MTAATRNILNVVRIIGGAAGFTIIAWMALDHRANEFREVLLVIFGAPAGAAALLLLFDKKSEI